MFTGIIRGVGYIQAIDQQTNFKSFVIAFPHELVNHLITGASVAINGCCLTVTAIEENRVTFDAMQETLNITNIDALQVNSTVNIERAACFGDEIGGHMMSGHIFCQAKLVERINTENNCTLWFSLPDSAKSYIFSKGYIGIDGVSLTLGEVQDNRFCVHLIPETIERTIIGQCMVGYSANIEIDPQTQVIVNTVERLLQDRFSISNS